MTSVASFEELPFPHPSRLPSVEDIQLHKATIKQLDQEIYVIKRQIDVLQTQLRNLQQKRANHASYIAPLRRLPTELLRYIVEICWESGIDMTVLLEMCSRVRQVVIGLSKVWSKIVIPGRPKEGHLIKVNPLNAAKTAL
jgi:hypothetical protein